MSVVTAVRTYGVPILSKQKSQEIRDYARGNPYAIKRVEQRADTYGFTEAQRALAKYVRENGIAISNICCEKSKKAPIRKYMKEHAIDLNVTGERRAEGGQRKTTHKSCFETGRTHDKTDKFMPIWWWSNEVKADFKQAEGLVFSDCYEIYGMVRTGCCGCPFNLNIAKDLEAMQRYEPKLFKACMNVFGQAYELTDRFHARRKKCLPDNFRMTLEQEAEKINNDGS